MAKAFSVVQDVSVWERLFDKDFINLSEGQIKSSGYVVDTMEAALWCFYN